MIVVHLAPCVERLEKVEKISLLFLGKPVLKDVKMCKFQVLVYLKLSLSFKTMSSTILKFLTSPPLLLEFPNGWKPLSILYVVFNVLLVSVQTPVLCM